MIATLSPLPRHTSVSSPTICLHTLAGLCLMLILSRMWVSLLLPGLGKVSPGEVEDLCRRDLDGSKNRACVYVA